MISELRKSKNLTQEELGAVMGVTRTTVSMWETGASFPRAGLLPKLAEVLGCTVDELLRPSEQKENPA